MEAIGLMPSDTGKPGGKKTGEKMADYAIDGGPFMQATEALLKTDFRITWFDRHPPAGTEIAAIFGDADDGDDDGGRSSPPRPGTNRTAISTAAPAAVRRRGESRASSCYAAMTIATPRRSSWPSTDK